MKKILQAMLLLFTILLFCNTSFCQKTTNSKKSDSSSLKNNDEQIIMSILYMQQAAEYRALCLQAYNIAMRKVQESIIQNILSNDTLPLAVVTDLDETAIDNSKDEVYQYLHDATYNGKQYAQWCQAELEDSIPGSVSFFNYVDQLKDARGRKIDIYYMSNRGDSLKPCTIARMKVLGFPQMTADHFMFVTDNTSKEPRRQKVLATHKIIVLLGDNMIDVDKAFDNDDDSQDRKNKVDSLRSLLGNLYVIFPNSIYGDWEKALYNGHYNSIQNEQKMRLGLLDGY